MSRSTVLAAVLALVLTACGHSSYSGSVARVGDIGDETMQVRVAIHNESSSSADVQCAVFATGSENAGSGSVSALVPAGQTVDEWATLTTTNSGVSFAGQQFSFKVSC